MQGRNRSPVEAIRSGSVGMGRTSPDRPFQNQGAYGSGNRTLRRAGYRRGPPKSHFSYPPPPPPPPRRKIDVFMEAGRLAAEYLVAKGVLPPSSLPRWGSNGGVHELKGRDRESAGYDGRVSALNRLGSSDGGSGRRRYGGNSNNDECDNVGTRNSAARGRRRRVDDHYSGNSHGSEWRRENERSGQWMDRSRRFNNNNGSGNNVGDFNEEDFAPGYRRGGFEDFGGGPRVARAVVESEQLSRNGITGESESDNYDFPDDVVLKDCFSNARRAPVTETDGGLNKEVGNARVSAVETGDEKSDRSSTVVGEEMEDNSDNSMVQDHLAVAREVSEQDIDLLRSCSFAKVPTRPRTPMGNRNLKVFRTLDTAETGKTDQQAITENSKITDAVSGAEPKVTAEKGSTNGSSSDEVTDLAHSSICSVPEKPVILPVQHIEESRDQSPDFPTDMEACDKSIPLSEMSSLSQHQNRSSNVMSSSVFATESKAYTKSLSFPERSSVAHNPVELSHSSSFGAPIVDLGSKMEDGFPLHSVMSEGNKRPRDWSSSIDLHGDDYLQIRNLRAKQSSSPGQTLMPDVKMVESIDQKKLVNAELFPRIEQETSIKVKEEKQFMPNSFKICDLNLIEAHDITEISDDPVPECTPGTALTMETRNVPSVDFGLSVGHNCNGTNLFGQCSNDNKVIQVIDLEDDSSAEDGACDNSKPKGEAMYSNLDNFLNQTDNTVDLPDIHDGYGLPISDLLGPDISSCPPGPGQMNNLQQGMNLLEEGLPGDDDSIYVSLGEIPISFMEAWDPPPQEYGGFRFGR